MIDTREPGSWPLVAGLSILAALVLGTTYAALGLFIDPIRGAFGSTNAQAARPVTAFVMAMNIALPLVGLLLDRLGARVVMLVGVLVTGIAYGLASRVHTLSLMTGAFALAGIGVGACTYLPCTIVISQRFQQHRGRALGIIFGISSIGSALLPVVLVAFMTTHEWRTVLAGIGGSAFVVGLPIIIGLVRPGPVTRKEQGSEAGKPCIQSLLKRRSYWLITSVLVLSQLSFAGIYFYLVPFFSNLGFPTQAASWFYGGTGIASFLGAMTFGPLMDKCGPKRVMIMALCTMTVGSLLLLHANSSGIGVAVAIAFALLWGSVVSTPYQFVPMLIAEVAGLRNLGKLLGISNLLAGVASSLGPTMTGALYDSTHNYAVAFECCAALAALSLVPAVLLPVGKR